MKLFLFGISVLTLISMNLASPVDEEELRKAEMLAELEEKFEEEEVRDDCEGKLALGAWCERSCDCCGATVACLAKRTGNRETDICRKADDNWFDKGLAAMYNGFASVKCIGR